jgi:polyisoprenyl-teichoic acid--peptidoglycan teichoic acid transferase
VNPPRTTLRAWTQRYVIALGVVFALTIGGVVGANVMIDSSLAGIHRVKLRTAALPGEAEAGNYLLIGSDSRAFVDNASDEGQFGDKRVEAGQRSDTMMIAHVDPDSEKALVVSIPRDLVVEVPGVGRTRINAAFAEADSIEAGAQKVIDTLQENFGLDIHHFVEVDFDSFRGVVNAIGSVHLYFPTPTRDDMTGLGVEAGCVALDGNDALAYVRSRSLEKFVDGEWINASPRADLDRIERQQEFVRRLGAVAFRKATKNPITAKNVADAVVPNLTMDDSFGRSQIFGLVNLFRSVDPSDPNQVEMSTFPNKPYGDGARLLPDQPAADELVARLNQLGAPSAASQEPAVKPKQVRVRVLNASGVNGLAAATLDALQRQFGFVADGEAGNWSEDLDQTQVRYGSDGLGAATLVQEKLGGQGALVPDSTIEGTNVAVVLGSDFSVVGDTPTTSASHGNGKRAKTTTTTAPADPAAACEP